MTPAELSKHIQNNPGSITIKLTTEGACCFEQGPDQNMVANIISFVPSESDPNTVWQMICDFDPYKTYNTKVAKTDWYKPGTTETGATWFSSGNYPATGTDCCYVTADIDSETDLNNVFTIISNPEAYHDAICPEANMLQFIYNDFWKHMWDKHPEWTAADLQTMQRLSHLQMYSFPQIWGSTALGFDTPHMLAGDAITTAQTNVLYVPASDCAVVYFDTKFAYAVVPTNENFWYDLNTHKLASVMTAKEKY